MYRGNVLLKNRKRLREHIIKYDFYKYFGKDWIDKNLLTYPDTPLDDIHRLYYYIANPNEVELFAGGLSYLYKEGKRKIFNKLKGKLDPLELLSLVRNLQTYYLFKRIEPETFFEAREGKSTRKKVDVILKINNKAFNIEIFCITASKLDKLEGYLADKIHALINNIPGNPYIVNFTILNNGLVNNNGVIININQEIERIKKFIKELITAAKRGSIRDLKKIYLNRKKQGLIEFELLFQDDHVGFVGVHGNSIKERSIDARRIKDRIIEKITNIQFPDRDSINAYVIYLEEFMFDFRDVDIAIKGQEKVVFTEGGATQTGRVQNGVIHNTIAGKKLFEWVDFFLVAKRPINLTEINERYLIINNDRKLISKDTIDDFFKKYEEFRV
jgi:hypothetical protein